MKGSIILYMSLWRWTLLHNSKQKFHTIFEYCCHGIKYCIKENMNIKLSSCTKRTAMDFSDNAGCECTTYRLVRPLSLAKPAEMGPVKPYLERFLSTIKTRGPTVKVRLQNIQALWNWGSSSSPINTSWR